MAYATPLRVSARPTPHPQRVTPLYLVDDLIAARRRYAALGFDIVETGDPELLGMRAGDTGFIVATAEHARQTMPSQFVEALQTGPVLYIWVDSVDAVRSNLADPVIDERVTNYGTWELFVESRVGLVIFAERLGQFQTRH
ncbi:MAG: hypothetical protein ACR2OX_05420 [Methyloligellaceae bacterium]